MARASEEIENPLTGERIVFLRAAGETKGELLEMDDFWTRAGHRAAEHVHPHMQERWEVIEGVASFRIAGVEQTAGPGGVVVARPEVPHLAWNPSAEPVHLRIQMCPALGWEEFVRGLFALARESWESGRGAIPSEALLSLISEFPRELALP